MANWLDIANDSYGAASALVEQKRWRSAISRAYYAAFSRVANLLVSHGVSMPKDWEGPSHAKIAGLICEKLTFLHDLRWRIFHWIRALYALRIDADYRPSMDMGGAHARLAISLMGNVFHYLEEVRS